MDFGYIIREQRKNLDISLREAAKRTGISHPYLSQLENGKVKKPTTDVVKKISLGMGIPYAFLLEQAGYFEEVNNTEFKRLNKAMEELKNNDSKLMKLIMDAKDTKANLEENLNRVNNEIVKLQNDLWEIRKTEEQLGQQMAQIAEHQSSSHDIGSENDIYIDATKTPIKLYKNGSEITGKERENLLKMIMDDLRK